MTTKFLATVVAIIAAVPLFADITVTGSGAVFGPADAVQVRCQVSGVGETEIEALEKAEAKTVQVREKLGSNAKVVVSSEQLENSDRFSSNGGEKSVKCVRELIVELPFPTFDAKKAIAELVANKATVRASYRSGIVKYGIRDGSKLVEQALDLAFEEGQRNAGILAKKAGLKVGKLLSVECLDQRSPCGGMDDPEARGEFRFESEDPTRVPVKTTKRFVFASQ